MPIVNIDLPTYEESERITLLASKGLISNVPKDQMAALVSNIANATITNAENNVSSIKSTMEEKIRDLQKQFSSIRKHAIYKLDNQELVLRIKVPKVNRDLPIMESDDIDSIDLSSLLPPTLRKQGINTILDLLKKEFPYLALSISDKKIPKFISSSPIPVNDEYKGNFFPQIEVDGEIAYIAWDSSASRIARGFKEKICDVLLGNNETFCGAVLSQENLKGIEEGAGVSAHFMTSKVTVIGILVIKPSKQYFLNDLVFDGPSSPERLACDGVSEGLTPFGMLGAKGSSVLNCQKGLLDRLQRQGEKLIPFCVEIIP